MELIFSVIIGAVLGGGVVACYFILKPDKADELHEDVKKDLKDKLS